MYIKNFGLIMRRKRLHGTLKYKCKDDVKVDIAENIYEDLADFSDCVVKLSGSIKAGNSFLFKNKLFKEGCIPWNGYIGNQIKLCSECLIYELYQV